MATIHTGTTGSLTFPQISRTSIVSLEDVNQAFEKMWNATTDEDFLMLYSTYRTIAEDYKRQQPIFGARSFYG